MTWDGIVTNKKYSREIGISDSVEAYIQTIIQTLESISFDYYMNQATRHRENCPN